QNDHGPVRRAPSQPSHAWTADQRRSLSRVESKYVPRLWSKTQPGLSTTNSALRRLEWHRIIAAPFGWPEAVVEPQWTGQVDEPDPARGPDHVRRRCLRDPGAAPRSRRESCV